MEHAIDYFIHESAIVDSPSKIGKGTKIWHFSHIMQNSTIGLNCNIGQNVVVSPGVILGNNVKVQNNVSIYTGVTCNDDVFLGPSMVFTNIINPRSAIIRRDKYVETLVDKGASIGANATIVCGNRIGKYSLIGAGAVVTKDVLNYEGDEAFLKGFELLGEIAFLSLTSEEGVGQALENYTRHIDPEFFKKFE